MLDIKEIRDRAKEASENGKNRHVDVDIEGLLAADEHYVALLQEVEGLRAERNAIAEQMKDAKGDSDLIAKGKELKQILAEKEVVMKEKETERHEKMLRVPNWTHPEVPVGDSDEENKMLRQVGEPVQIEDPKDHLELMTPRGLVDFERGANVAGAKFYFLKEEVAILEQALVRYGIDFMRKEGFELIATPDIAKEDVLVAKGFLPRGPEKQVYYLEGEDLALVGTAEIPMLGYHMNETLDGTQLPKKYVAVSHCFRTEAGAYGRESQGLYRVHQFTKVEMFAFCKPEQSEALHVEMLHQEEAFWKSLEIPFRVVDCCTGDLGGSDYRRYDLEAWMWGKNDKKGGWGEVTSCSNCGDFQARRMRIKYQEGKEKGFVHTLNGTVVAAPRAIIAIMENGQQKDGSVKIPDVLQPYCGFDRIQTVV